MVGKSRHKTHLPYKFLLPTPEENLMAAVIKQAWCDALVDELSIGEKYRKKSIIEARQMFEASNKDNLWRQSMSYLICAIQIDEDRLIDGYWKYKKFIQDKKVTWRNISEAFDVLLKILVKNR